VTFDDILEHLIFDKFGSGYVGEFDLERQFVDIDFQHFSYHGKLDSEWEGTILLGVLLGEGNGHLSLLLQAMFQM